MNGDKARRAQYTFEAFLAPGPSMARSFQGWKVDEIDRHADVNATMTDGSRVDFQLVEWLEAGQMQESVNRQTAAEKILKALLEFYPRPPLGLWSVALVPVLGIRPPDRASLSSVVTEFGEFVTQVSNDWPKHPEWNGPQGYLCRNLGRWPRLGSYFCELHFNLYPPDPGWIMFEPVGGACDPHRALRTLFDAVRKKMSHYGRPGKTPVELVVHYSRAAIRNTPFHSVEIQEFEDVARWLAEEVPGLLRSLGACPFRTIYLLDEGYPNPVAFAVYPAFNRCV